jgi:hypothetical protein
MIVAPLRKNFEAPLHFEQGGVFDRHSSTTVKRLRLRSRSDGKHLSIRPVMGEPQSNFLGLRGFYNQDIPPRSVANAKDSLYRLVFIRSADAGPAGRIVRAS